MIAAETYRIDTEEEPIDGLSFLAWRRLATFIRIPVHRSGTVQSFLIDPKKPCGRRRAGSGGR